jgi:hypothetical protein
MLRTRHVFSVKKKTVLSVLLLMLVLAMIAPVQRRFVVDVIRFNRDEWMASRRFSRALQGARSVVLVEFANDIVLAHTAATPEDIAGLRRATGTWSWLLFPKAPLCFEPHHRVEVVGVDGSNLQFEVCFLCGNFVFSDDPLSPILDLPPSWRKSLTSFFSSVGMPPRSAQEYLQEETSKRARRKAEGVSP